MICFDTISSEVFASLTKIHTGTYLYKQSMTTFRFNFSGEDDSKEIEGKI